MRIRATVTVCLLVLVFVLLLTAVHHEEQADFFLSDIVEPAKLYRVKYWLLNGGHVVRMEAVKPNALLLPGNVIAFKVLED